MQARRVFPCAVLDDAELAAEQQGIIKDALLQINGHTFLVGQVRAGMPVVLGGSIASMAVVISMNS